MNWSSVKGLGGRFCNKVIINTCFSILSEKNNLYIDYDYTNECNDLGINLFCGTNKYNNTVFINDNNLIPKPLIYLSVSSIQSIQRDGDFQLIMMDNQIDPITLDFITKFDADQAYSILNYLLQDSFVDINSLGIDSIPPQIFFNENFFGIPITLDPPSGVGPFSTTDSNNFRIDINLSSFPGPIPITKSDLISGMIYDVIDDRDKNILLIEDDILIYKDVINNQNLVDNISIIGNYIINIIISDLGQNQTNMNILISVS